MLPTPDGGADLCGAGWCEAVDAHRWPDDVDAGPWETWGWPYTIAGLVIIDIWLTTLGVWWFGWWPPGG